MSGSIKGAVVVVNIMVDIIYNRNPSTESKSGAAIRGVAKELPCDVKDCREGVYMEDLIDVWVDRKQHL